jgi:hypothetical protein
LDAAEVRVKALQVFIGYDSRQPVAFHVAAHSIQSRCSKPVAITRLQLNQLPITRRGLTEFTYSRFLAPWLCGFTGYSLFVDADMLCRGDIADLAKRVDPAVAVSVVMHEKAFERPSLMVFNNDRCRALTPAFVENKQHALFDLAWAAGSLGALERDWNHLVGYDAPNPDAKIVHFTQGVPCWPETKDSEFAAEWIQELRQIGSTVSFHELMGRSVHPVAQQAKQTVGAHA